MSRKFVPFILALILFSALVSVEANSCCSHKKRSYDLLDKRNKGESSKCPCALAEAAFSDKVKGITVFSQNECGITTITGFLTGLVDPCKNNYTFFIVDRCGNVLDDLTNVLHAKINNDGTTQFTAKDDKLNLNCDKDGILNAFCSNKTTTTSCYPTTTATYHKYYKRDTGSSMRINQNGGPYALANIGGI
ncbi:7610_t:CDS:1 [Acaulospora colombiana]|uniref:7610_t:CDS:1 n=1 Tax=Acaulospora colombiana TaxID=27376 RepID=A0ACA9K9U0_9GLOM|nr:7610_t:CDS:1 [Acaulospora colombiana]